MQNNIMVKVEMMQGTGVKKGDWIFFGNIVGFEWEGSTYDVPVAEYPHDKGKLLLILEDLPAPLRNCYAATNELYKLIDRWDGEWV
jgi:hypothetical protein